MTVATAHTDIIFEFVCVPIGAGGPEIMVNHIECFAEIVAPTPAGRLACRGAPIPLSIAVGATAGGIEFVQVQFLVFPGAMLFNLLPNAFDVEVRVPERSSFASSKLCLRNCTVFPSPIFSAAKNVPDDRITNALVTWETLMFLMQSETLRHRLS